MFSFWVNDTTNFPVTQAWHLHTMPALIMVKYSFDYFTPFKTILWQFLSLESQLPGPLFPTFPPPLPVCTICCCQHLTVGAPLGTIQRPGMLAESGPSWPQVHLSQLLLKEIPVKLLLSPSLPSFFFFFLIQGIESNIFIFCIWNHSILCSKLWETKPLKNIFQNSSLI